MREPAVSVVVPTRNRAGYLEVTLASLAAQAPSVPYEVIVVDDGSSDATAEVVAGAASLAQAPDVGSARPGDANPTSGPRVAYLRHKTSRGPNAARNAGIAAARGALIALIDDDVRVPPDWVGELAAGAERHRWAEALGGPIRASLEGPAPRSCGRESAPVTTLDLGPRDCETDFVWSANMAVRRGAIERIGGFDEQVPIYGDEEEWLIRLHANGGRVAYVAGAWLEHRRAGDDARLRSLARAEYRRGRAARRNDRRKGTAQPLHGELRDLAGAGWHTARRRCAQGLIMGAHSTGRLVEALRGR
ncbi:MAG TPA: glycosyltransferase family 2 protein [Thermoleophilaceae bacterium]|nr:glycosyltransferase family 2 protein [Thermoleophilaceae bacterium]